MPTTAHERMMTVAERLAEEVAGWGITRVHGLCGGHIQLVWDALSRRGVGILDVRHEGSAVYTAHAQAALGDGLAVCVITAGPGFTNALTGIANAAKAGAAVLVITGRPPLPQLGLGAMQDVPQAEMVRDWVAFAATVHSPRTAVPLLRRAAAAAVGAGGCQGPAIVEIPTDVQAEAAAPSSPPKPSMTQTGLMQPVNSAVEEAALTMRAARRPLVIGGRDVRREPALARELLKRTGAVYLDTTESRGALRPQPSAAVPALRGRAMAQADLVVTLGRRLDFQLAYGSGAIFDPRVRFLRIGRGVDELFDTAAEQTTVQGDLGPTLSELSRRRIEPESLDTAWVNDMVSCNKEKVDRLQQTITSQSAGSDGRMHPFTLIAALNEWLGDDAVAVVDGGDILSFARVALAQTADYLDCGPYGTLGVGVPFALSAALSDPRRQTLALVGDGSLGFTAMELHTAARHVAPVVIVVANNEAWNIERHDQLSRFDGNLVGVDLEGVRYDHLAAACGLDAQRIEDPAALPSALKRAASRAPSLVEVMVTRDATSPDFRSGLAAVPTYQALATWDEAEREYQRSSGQDP